MAIPIVLFIVMGVVMLSRGNVGDAVAQRILHGAAPDGRLETEVDLLRGEVEALRQELVEAQERLDFTERLLARAPETPHA